MMMTNNTKEIDDGEFWLPSDFLDDNTMVMATSPQSTLKNWSFSSSPESPSTPFAPPRRDALETLYQAAGQLHQKEALIQHQLRTAHFYHLKKQQLIKQQQQFAAAAAALRRQNRSAAAAAAAWPPLQQKQMPQRQYQAHQSHDGSVMRAVFLNGNNTARRESAGTGVFIPKRAGTPVEPKKKSTSATILLPERVIQALNLNISEVGVHTRFPNGYVLDSDVMMGSVGKRSHYHPQQAPAEIMLPPEWTY